MAHAIPHPERPQLDYNRIAGNAGAIAVNAVLLMLLLVPLSAPHLIEKPEEIITNVFELERPKKKEPDPIVERKIEKVTKPQPSITPKPVLVETPPQPVVDPIETDSIYVPESPPQPETFASNTIGRGEVLMGATLQVINNPPPSYPGEAVRNGLTGTVMLEILVGVDGKPLEVSVVKSSGHRVLDQAAKRVVLSRWTFQPALENGQPVQARGRVPIEFTLDR
ncbi:energy transducer TonB [Lysobacter silvisoli]|uniref:Energy transducer TonB n=1 Tax=Lysobacter silvisoli TaxID=2293254 RepID=A0A371K5A3_9GAMM|nr:energy transducer TonB [Lysobacter silvisoli]RDZ29042.1 energy transducer TonB [Lysobacter silvisoli]